MELTSFGNIRDLFNKAASDDAVENPRYHLVMSNDGSDPVPMKLLLINSVVARAEVPDASGQLKPDFGFYKNVVENRSLDAWPEISAEDFKFEMALVRQRAGSAQNASPAAAP